LKATEQAAAAAADPDDSGPAPRPSSGKNDLAGRAAAIIAGKVDPGAKAAGDRAADDAADEAGQVDGGDDAEQLGQQRAADDPGDDDDTDDDDEDPDGDDAGPGPVANLDDAAKRLGMTRQEFNAIPVQVGGASLTLGELKAKLPELLKLDARAAELDDARGGWELERVASYRNIHAILDALPRGAVNPQVLHTLQRQHEETRTHELEALHFARPKWADATYSTGAREAIATMAKDYGFSRAEINGLMDHRMVLLAQDYAELRAKVKESRDSARKVNEPGANRPTGQAGAARGGAVPANNGARSKDTRDGLAQRAGAIMRRR
jgi:hypothetical protein